MYNDQFVLVFRLIKQPACLAYGSIFRMIVLYLLIGGFIRCISCRCGGNCVIGCLSYSAFIYLRIPSLLAEWTAWMKETKNIKGHLEEKKHLFSCNKPV